MNKSHQGRKGSTPASNHHVSVTEVGSRYALFCSSKGGNQQGSTTIAKGFFHTQHIPQEQ